MPTYGLCMLHPVKYMTRCNHKIWIKTVKGEEDDHGVNLNT